MMDGDAPRAGPSASPGFLLWHVGLRWRALLAEQLGPLGLTPAQFDVLAAVAWLERTGGPPMQREVAAHAGTDPMMTSQILRALEQRKLVARRPDPEDGRAWRVAATALGMRRFGEGVNVVHRASRAFFEAPLGRLEPLMGCLRALADAAAGAPTAPREAEPPAKPRASRKGRKPA